MNNLWEFKFDDENTILTPAEIVTEQCNVLASLTDQKIFGIVKEYDGPTKSYSIETNLFSQITSNLIVSSQTHNVQKDLGEIPESENFVYEFYLTSRNTPKYKYRVMFFSHPISIYPIEVTLEESLSNEINPENNNFYYNCNDQEEFVKLLKQVLNSKAVTIVIKNLLAFNKDDIS